MGAWVLFQLKCEVCYFNTAFFFFFFTPFVFLLLIYIRLWQAGTIHSISFESGGHCLFSAGAFWANSSELTSSDRSVSTSWWMKVIVYSIVFFFPFTVCPLTESWYNKKKNLILSNVLDTFVLLLDMIAFLVLNSGVESHRCKRVCKRHDSGRRLGSARADLQFVN